ncbi:DNA polymerase IV [Hathewaya histolytica]|uniref:DNA polymerase IV n=1 Tax=Hathewaya histolytica TaxID=1498 RepID=A0A4U9QYU0_HATHI|nr:DNA polymerase IV [Hathewaya histolytica]VTQ83051.1 nucleotidyltransferase/DNA polymerase involved in DNA repair [Hathewaya histolytica]
MRRQRLIFHIDVNSAFLSWTAVYLLKNGNEVDIRKIPSVIGGDPHNRRGVVLAKSEEAKKYNINTGETLFSAFRKCPNLRVESPYFDLYKRCSNAMINILEEYTPLIQRYSIDECFLDFSNMEHIYKDYYTVAKEISKRIYRELGFTVNIGIGDNKLLAKMASDFEKPNKIHTLFKSEIKDKMWPLPIEKLFMVGTVSAKKLKNVNINTIGDLASCDKEFIQYLLKSHGIILWEYAKGIDKSPIINRDEVDIKSISNSTTTPHDIITEEEAIKVILGISENVGRRIRQEGKKAFVISITLKNKDFISRGKQKMLVESTNCTETIFREACDLFKEFWIGEPLRLIGVGLSELTKDSIEQLSFFSYEGKNKTENLDKTMDTLRNKYGENSIKRSTLIK